MNPSPRTPAPPRRLALGSAAVSSICGIVLLVAGPTASAPLPSGLVPATVVGHALRQLPAEARNVRFNGLYGSGHAGAWEFVAHLTWRDAAGALRGGQIHLPETAGQAPFATIFDISRLDFEEQIGWQPSALSRSLRRLLGHDASLALIEFVPDPGLRIAPLVACGANAPGTATCVGHHVDASTVTFSDEIIEVPFGRALSIQRRGAPIASTP
jgi:hypothetical protein